MEQERERCLLPSWSALHLFTEFLLSICYVLKAWARHWVTRAKSANVSWVIDSTQARTSLVVQWTGVCQPGQGTQVRSLIS